MLIGWGGPPGANGGLSWAQVATCSSSPCAQCPLLPLSPSTQSLTWAEGPEQRCPEPPSLGLPGWMRQAGAGPRGSWAGGPTPGHGSPCPSWRAPDLQGPPSQACEDVQAPEQILPRGGAPRPLLQLPTPQSHGTAPHSHLRGPLGGPAPSIPRDPAWPIRAPGRKQGDPWGEQPGLDVHGRVSPGGGSWQRHRVWGRPEHSPALSGHTELSSPGEAGASTSQVTELTHTRHGKVRRHGQARKVRQNNINNIEAPSPRPDG